MRARIELVSTLEDIKTRASVKQRYDHIRDMQRLCRSDNMGLRGMVPSLLLQLDMDQDCYDYIKWWCTEGERVDYDWGDMDEPFLNLKNADVFEEVDWVCRRYTNLSFIVAIMLLKIKLMQDLLCLENAALFAGRLPQEIIDRIKAHAVRTHIIAAKRSLMEGKSLKDFVNTYEKLGRQISQLFDAVNNANKFFWDALLLPDHHLSAMPQYHSDGSIEEMQVVLQYSYDAWASVPGADLMIAQLRGYLDGPTTCNRCQN